MTQEQKDEIEATIAYVRSANDVLELHELRLRDFGDVKADPSDPYSLDVEEVADALDLARDNLHDAEELLRVFVTDNVEEGK